MFAGLYSLSRGTFATSTCPEVVHSLPIFSAALLAQCCSIALYPQMSNTPPCTGFIIFTTLPRTYTCTYINICYVYNITCTYIVLLIFTLIFCHDFKCARINVNLQLWFSLSLSLSRAWFLKNFTVSISDYIQFILQVQLIWNYMYMLYLQDAVTRRSNSSWCLAPIFWTFGIARRVCKREWMIGGRSELGYHSVHVEWPTPQKHGGGKWRVWWINWITLGMNEKKGNSGHKRKLIRVEIQTPFKAQRFWWCCFRWQRPQESL